MKNTIKIIGIILLFSCSSENETKPNISPVNTEIKEHKQLTNNEIKDTTKPVPITEKDNTEPILSEKVDLLPTTIIGTIQDKDGFTNVRNKANKNATVIFKLLENQYFFYDKNNIDNWMEITTPKGRKGYIHKSRIKEINQDDLFYIHYYESNDKNKKRTDTIVNSHFLDEYSPLNYTFNYDNFTKTSQENNSVIYELKECKIEITKTKFLTEKHVIKKDENESYIVKIDGEEYYGRDGGLPTEEFKEIKITENNTSFSIPKMVFKNLYEPSIQYVEIFKTPNNRLIIHTFNSDAAGSYVAIFVVKNKKVIHRIVSIPF